MGMKYSTQGGSGTGLGTDWATFLQQGLQTGSFSSAGASSQAHAANPVGSTQGIAGVLNDLLSAGGGRAGGAMAQQIGQQQTNDVNAMRSRFGVGGGTAFGTPAQYAESTYRAQAAPAITSAIGNLQLSALGQLLPMLNGTANKDISQAENVATPNTGMSIFSGIAQALPALMTLFSSMKGGSGGGQAPGTPVTGTWQMPHSFGGSNGMWS